MYMDDWRDDRSIFSFSIYKKKFAFLPKECSDGQKVWFKPYYDEYRKHILDSQIDRKNQVRGHVDYIGAHSEETYMIMKLAE